MNHLFEEYGSMIYTAIFGATLIVIFTKILNAVMTLNICGTF